MRENCVVETRVRSVVCGVFAALLVLTFWGAQAAFAQLPSQLKAQEQIVRAQMLTMSRQLGTTCNTCHNPKNFASNEKANFKISKDHLRLVQLLIDNGMDGQSGRPKADCYLCHRGELKPHYKEAFDPLTMKKTNPKSNANTSDPSEEDPANAE